MNPLSKKIRLLSLIVTLLLFIIIGPLVWAYSVGYRFDSLSESFGWVKTGGIYINSDISSTEVFIDGKFVKSGGFLLRNVLVQNLRSDQEYIVEVHKDGYHSWRKVLTVLESYVTEARTMMLPKEINRAAIYPYLDNLGNGFIEFKLPEKDGEEPDVEEQNGPDFESEAETGSEPGVLIIDIEDVDMEKPTIEDLLESGTVRINQNYVDMQILFELTESTGGVFDTINKTLRSLVGDSQDFVNQELNSLSNTDSDAVVEKSDIPEYFNELGVEDPGELKNLITNNYELLWLEDGNITIHWVGKESDTPYYYCDLVECKTSLFIDWETEITRFDFLPGRGDVLVLLNKDGIWAMELDGRSTRNIQPIYLGEHLDFRVNNNNRIVVLDNEVFYELRF